MAARLSYSESSPESPQSLRLPSLLFGPPHLTDRREMIEDLGAAAPGPLDPHWDRNEGFTLHTSRAPTTSCHQHLPTFEHLHHAEPKPHPSGRRSRATVTIRSRGAYVPHPLVAAHDDPKAGQS